MTNYKRVLEFHEKFGVPVAKHPMQLTAEDFHFRYAFMHEELEEFAEAWGASNLVKQADALIDLAYVVFGTAAMMGLPWEKLFDAVHEANMKKRKTLVDEPGSRHKFDVRKPEGWVGPEDAMRKILGIDDQTESA